MSLPGTRALSKAYRFFVGLSKLYNETLKRPYYFVTNWYYTGKFPREVADGRLFYFSLTYFPIRV